MRGVQAAFDASGVLPDRPIRVALRDGLHVRVVQRITAAEARELIAELQSALAKATNHAIRERITPTIFRTPAGSD